MGIRPVSERRAILSHQAPLRRSSRAVPRQAALGRPAPGKPQGFLSEFWDAVSIRTVSMIIGVFLLQIAFILSYVGAFHSPAPHRIPLAVVAPAPEESGPIVTKLNLIPSTLHATAASSQAAARRLIRDDAVSAALVINPAAKTDTLLIASAAGNSEASAAEQIIAAVEASQHRAVTVTDIVPVQPGDYRGLTGFCIEVGAEMTEFETATLKQRAPLSWTAAEKVFGYRPRYSLRDGIKSYAEFCAAFKNHPCPVAST